MNQWTGVNRTHRHTAQRATTRHSPPSAAALESLQATTRRAGVGFLAIVVLAIQILLPCYAQQITASEAIRHVGQTQTVCGVVASTNYAFRSRGQPTFLNLDRPYPNHIFTALIWGSNRHKFTNPPEIYYRNKRICVSGRITTYRGKAQIDVREPSQISLGSKPQGALDPHNAVYHERYSVEQRKALKEVFAILGYRLDYKSAIWDAATDQAVRDFQSSHGLISDGKIGSQTLRSLGRLVASSEQLDATRRFNISQALDGLALSYELAGSYQVPATGTQRYYGYRYYGGQKRIRVGEEVEYYDYDTGENRYGDVESISGGEVEIYDYDLGEYRYVDTGDVEQ